MIANTKDQMRLELIHKPYVQTIFQETVQENLPIGSKLLRIQAFDADSGDNAKLLYRISYRENPEKFPFEVETDSGWITTNRELDREEQSRYDFEVIAADSGDVPLSSTASVVIVLQDVNDNGKIKTFFTYLNISEHTLSKTLMFN